MTIDLLELPYTTSISGLVCRRFRGEADYPAMSEVVNASNAADLVEETESAESIANVGSTTLRTTQACGRSPGTPPLIR